MLTDYLQHGWSLIPVEAGGKLPIGKWQHAQTERASLADAHLWRAEGSNLGLVTGELSNVIVIDCDTDEAVLSVAKLGIPITPTATTGRGRHYFVSYSPGVRNSAGRIAPGVDVRGEGGFVVLPPSVHPNGQSYRWVDGLSIADVPLAPCPDWVVSAAEEASVGRTGQEWTAEFTRTVGNGERNHACATLAGYLLRKYVETSVVEELLLGWNRLRCFPPMAEGEVRRTVKSIAAREERRRGE